MTLKMIAIGLLALLGLSSVMSPKAFRVFLGGLGALCMALFVGLVATGDRKATNQQQNVFDKVRRLVGVQPDWMDSAGNILNDIREGKPGDPSLQDLLPSGSEPPKKISTPRRNPFPSVVAIARKPIIINRRYGQESQRDQIVADIQANIDEYLEEQQGVLGVEKLNHKDLDPSLLRYVGRTLQDGRREVYLVFDQKYAEHVRTRGRQMIRRDRLGEMAFVAIGAAATLLITYGVMKVINRQAAPDGDDDYLRNSNISMV